MFSAEQKNGPEYDRRFHDAPPSLPPISHILHGCATYLQRNKTTSPHLGNSSTQYIPRGYRSTNGANAFGDVFSFWKHRNLRTNVSHSGVPNSPRQALPPNPSREERTHSMASIHIMECNSGARRNKGFQYFTKQMGPGNLTRILKASTQGKRYITRSQALRTLQ